MRAKNLLKIALAAVGTLSLLGQGCNDGAHIDMCSNHGDLCRTNCTSVRTAMDKYKNNTQLLIDNLIAKNDPSLQARIEELRLKIPTYDIEYARAYDSCMQMPFTAYNQQGDGVPATADNRNEACSCYSTLLGDNGGGSDDDSSGQDQQNLLDFSHNLGATNGVQQLGATNAGDATAGQSGDGVTGGGGSGSRGPGIAALTAGNLSKGGRGGESGAASGVGGMFGSGGTQNAQPDQGGAAGAQPDNSMAAVGEYGGSGGAGGARKGAGGDGGSGMDLSSLFGGKGGAGGAAAAGGVVTFGARNPAQAHLMGTPDREDYFSMNGAQDDLFIRNTRAITSTSKRW